MAAKGYTGGDGEEQLVAAISALLDEEEEDTVKNIKNKYWVIGSAIEIAIARGYTKAPGLRGWFFNNFKKGETHAKECLRCWQDRDAFDRVYAWWKTGNTGFVPSKVSGPRFSNEICKAYRERLTSDADKLARKNRGKNLSAKQLREQAALWRARYDRLKGEHLAWSKQDQREPRELIAIEIEIAADETPEAELPIHATRPTDTSTEDDATDGDAQTDPATEQHPGADDPVVSDPIVELDPIVTPDPVVELDPSTKPDVLSASAVTGDQRDDIERQYKLPANWSGAKATTEKAAHRIVAYRNARAHFYLVCGADLTPDEHAAARKVGKDKTTWEAGTPIASVLAKIAALMTPTQKPEGE